MYNASECNVCHIATTLELIEPIAMQPINMMPINAMDVDAMRCASIMQFREHFPTRFTRCERSKSQKSSLISGFDKTRGSLVD